jgi:hypothetical protein
MALPSSGVITFNDVRTEISQSTTTNYSFAGWASGFYNWFSSSGAQNYAPINLLSSGSIFSESNPLSLPLSMSAWYSYDHNTYIGLGTTASLYQHTAFACFPSSMIIIDAGTTSTTLSINISGSGFGYGYGCWVLFYGKPWASDASNGSIIPGCACCNAGNAVLIDSGSSAIDVNKTITYSYTYDSSIGSKLYFVLYGDPCFSP